MEENQTERDESKPEGYFVYVMQKWPVEPQTAPVVLLRTWLNEKMYNKDASVATPAAMIATVGLHLRVWQPSWPWKRRGSWHEAREHRHRAASDRREKRGTVPFALFWASTKRHDHLSAGDSCARTSAASILNYTVYGRELRGAPTSRATSATADSLRQRHTRPSESPECATDTHAHSHRVSEVQATTPLGAPSQQSRTAEASADSRSSAYREHTERDTVSREHNVRTRAPEERFGGRAPKGSMYM